MKIARTPRAPFVFGLLSLLLAATPCPAQSQTNHDEIFPVIKMDDVPVADAVKHLARQAGMNCIIDPRVQFNPGIPSVSIAFTNLTAKEALDKILKIRRLVRIENPATTVCRIAPENLGIKPVDPQWLKNDTNAVIPVIVMEEVPLRDALVNLARQVNWTINFDGRLPAPALSAPVSIRWNKLTCKQALIALLDNFDLTIIDESSAGVVGVTKKKTP